MIKTIKKFMPKISDTERAALECGTISIDGDIFKGTLPEVNPTDYNSLTSEEKLFLDNIVPRALALHKTHGYTSDNDLHKNVWKFLKNEKFFSMLIPKEHGGLGFSPTAQSLVVSKIASAGYTGIAVTVMVPNSLGPGELLMHYGTEKQQKKYLPKLASGKMIPCFGLTGLHNGSDATTHIDSAGVTEEGDWVVTLNKRYITLAPVADLIGLAVKVPEHGITLFLVERNHPGLEIGDRHNPMGQAFMNGTIKGTIKLNKDNIIGAENGLGKGWKMLVECLSVGRAISLPALGTAACARSALAAGSYANARKQFGLRIADMEGVQEHLADLAFQSYLTLSVQKVINGELQKGESPSALSAMWKYQATERGRISVNRAMDVLAGAAIQEGPNNVIAEQYKSIPIAITVEGANILSRSLVTFGGGLMRSHPHLKDLVDSIQDEDTNGFLSNLRKMVGHTITNFFKALGGNKYALFAFTSNMVLTLGKKYKSSEYISGRMADIFSSRVFHATLIAQESNTLRNYSLDRIHNEEYQAYIEVTKELPLFARLLVRLARKRNFNKMCHSSPAKNKKAADCITDSNSEFVKELTKYVHLDGRMEELVNSFKNDELKNVVIEVDSNDGKLKK